MKMLNSVIFLIGMVTIMISQVHPKPLDDDVAIASASQTNNAVDATGAQGNFIAGSETDVDKAIYSNDGQIQAVAKNFDYQFDRGSQGSLVDQIDHRELSQVDAQFVKSNRIIVGGQANALTITDETRYESTGGGSGNTANIKSYDDSGLSVLFKKIASRVVSNTPENSGTYVVPIAGFGAGIVPQRRL